MTLNFNVYGFIIAIIMFFAFIYLVVRIRQLKLPSPFFFLLGLLFVIPFIFLGARVWTLFSQEFFTHLNQQSSFGERILFFLGISGDELRGLSIHGAIVFGFIYLLFFFRLYGKKYSYSMFFCFDLFLPIVLFAQIIGRWGNFFNQEILGPVFTDNYPTEYEWIPSNIANLLRRSNELNSILREPLFLYESVSNFGLLLIIFWVYPLICKFLSPRPWNINIQWKKNRQKHFNELGKFSVFQWNYWKIRKKIFQLNRFYWKRALDNPNLDLQNVPKINLSSNFFQLTPNSRTNYYYAQQKINRDYRGVNKYFKLIRLFFLRNSTLLTNYFNPYKLVIPRCGTKMGLYFIGYGIIRLGLQNLRDLDTDKMDVTIPFSIFFIIFGFLFFLFAQFIFPRRFRSESWYYETRY